MAIDAHLERTLAILFARAAQSNAAREDRYAFSAIAESVPAFIIALACAIWHVLGPGHPRTHVSNDFLLRRQLHSVLLDGFRGGRDVNKQGWRGIATIDWRDSGPTAIWQRTHSVGLTRIAGIYAIRRSDMPSSRRRFGGRTGREPRDFHGEDNAQNDPGVMCESSFRVCHGIFAAQVGSLPLGPPSVMSGPALP